MRITVLAWESSHSIVVGEVAAHASREDLITNGPPTGAGADRKGVPIFPERKGELC